MAEQENEGESTMYIQITTGSQREKREESRVRAERIEITDDIV